MRSMYYSGDMQVITLALDPGELLLESIRETIREHDIKNGVVVSGIATLKKCNMHYINHDRFPSDDTIYSVEHPLEVGSINGLIADYEPHIHIISGFKDQKTWTGHLEDGSVVCYLAEICILKFNALTMTRTLNPANHLRALGPQ